MRRELLTTPLPVENEDGSVKVELKIAASQAGMGEALTIDTIVGSCDAEVLATGPSDKGPGRGAILRHGANTLWSFNGNTEQMTTAGRALFVNTVAFAARQGGLPVLEKRMNGTRDSLFASLEFVKRSPGYINTMRRLYLPKELATAEPAEVKTWLEENRPYLRTNGRRYELDELAKNFGIPNHCVAFLARCITKLRDQRDRERCHVALVRYTGQNFPATDAKAWAKWFKENRDYLYFSDSEGFIFKVDEEAKRRGVPFQKLRGWSSEEIDYRP